MVDLKMRMALNGGMKRESGQIGLIVLLIMVVVTTIAVSVSTRSVSELRISRQEQESTRSLDLAESGIEEILASPLVPGSSFKTIAGKRVDYSISANSTVATMDLLSGHTLELDLTNATNIKFDWSAGTLCNTAVVLAIISPTAQVSRNAYVHTGCPAIGNITATWNPATGLNISGQKLARIKALYSTITLSGVALTGALNPIYYTVNSTSQMDDGSTRTVQVNKFPGSLPSIFDYVLFSGTSLVK